MAFYDEKDNDAHEALIGSQVLCIKQYIEDFKRESVDCKHYGKIALTGCNHMGNPFMQCKWEGCPLK